jgi:hypothetical protein
MYFFPRDVEKTSSSGFIVAWRLMNMSTMLCHVNNRNKLFLTQALSYNINRSQMTTKAILKTIAI